MTQRRFKGLSVVWALLLCLMVPSGVLGQFPGLQRVVTTDSLKVRNIAAFDSTAQFKEAQGSKPFSVLSSTFIDSLNSDFLDSQHGSYYLDSDNFTGTEWDSLTDGSDIYLHIHDVRYYTETELDAGQLDNRYYTETEIDARVISDLTDVNTSGVSVGNFMRWNGTVWADSIYADSEIDHGGLSGLGDDDHTIYSLVDGTRVFTGVVGGIDPTASNHLATKEYVDMSVSFIDDFYFNDDASDIGGIYYDMIDLPTGEGESSFTTVGLGTGDGQALVNWATVSGVPGVNTLKAGLYTAHLHVEVTVGNKPTKIFFEIYTRTHPGGAETLRATSEISDYITSKVGLNLHASISSDVNINTTDRIVFKWFANVEATGNAVTVVLYAEGVDNSHASIPTGTDILSSVFVRQDGTRPLSANWDAGSYTITGTQFISDIAGGTAPFVVTSTTVVANLQAATAAQWTTTRTIDMSGDVSADAVNIDGSGNVIITNTVVANDSHTHDTQYYTEGEIDVWAGTTNITTLGTIGTGTWEATVIDEAYLDHSWSTQFTHSGTIQVDSLSVTGNATVVGTVQAEHLYSTDDAQIDGQVFINSADAMLAHVNITGDAASIGDREYGLWMRGKYGAFIVQLNVHGSKLEVGGGASLDTTPALTVDYLSGQIAAPITGSGAGILIGGDFQIYRSAPNVGFTPDSFIVNANLMIGTSTAVGKLTVDSGSIIIDHDRETADQFIIRGKTDVNQQLTIGYDTTNDHGTIQAVKQGAAFEPLQLNPFGGNVIIGAVTTPTHTLEVIGSFLGGGAADHTEIEADGDVNFVGGGGLQYAEIKVEHNAVETTITTAGDSVKVTIFDTIGPINGNMTASHTSDYIVVGVAGDYMILVSATINSISGAGSLAELNVLKNNAGASIVTHMDRDLIGGGGESGVFSISGIATCAADDTISVWITNETNTQNYVVEDISLTLIQIGGGS